MAFSPQAEKILAHVRNECNFVWDAYDQGRFAFAVGQDKDRNPHLDYHVNFRDWNRGWEDEQKSETDR